MSLRASPRAPVRQVLAADADVDPVDALQLSSDHFPDADEVGTTSSPEELRLTSERHSIRGNLIHSLVQLPQNATSSCPIEGWPLVVWLHGLFECGSTLEDLSKVKHVAGHLPALVLTTPELRQCVVLSPQCPPRAWWDGDVVAQVISEVIDDLALYYNVRVDPWRIYLAGCSMGGYAVYSILSKHPELFAAAVPICGALDPWSSPMLATTLAAWSAEHAQVEAVAEEALAAAKAVPLWAFHGYLDPVVTASSAQRAVDALTEAGSEVARISVFPLAGHQAWKPALTGNTGAELFAWLFAQRNDRLEVTSAASPLRRSRGSSAAEGEACLLM